MAFWLGAIGDLVLVPRAGRNDGQKPKEPGLRWQKIARWLCYNPLVASQARARIAPRQQTIFLPSNGLISATVGIDTPVGFFYGEGETMPAPSNTNKTGLLIAADIMALPDNNIRKSVYHLVRAINRAHEDKENTKKVA